MTLTYNELVGLVHYSISKTHPHMPFHERPWIAESAVNEMKKLGVLDNPDFSSVKLISYNGGYIFN